MPLLVAPQFAPTVNHIQRDWFGSMLVPSQSSWSWGAPISSGKLFQWMNSSWSWPLCSYSHSFYSSTGFWKLSSVLWYESLEGWVFTNIYCFSVRQSHQIFISTLIRRRWLAESWLSIPKNSASECKKTSSFSYFSEAMNCFTQVTEKIKISLFLPW